MEVCNCPIPDLTKDRLVCDICHRWHLPKHGSTPVPDELGLGVIPAATTLSFAPLPVTDLPDIGRNDPCPCGSKKKYKKCCIKFLTATVPSSRKATASANVRRRINSHDTQAFESPSRV